MILDPDGARVLVEFRLERPDDEQLREFVHQLAQITVRGVEFTGVYTLVPPPQPSSAPEATP